MFRSSRTSASTAPCARSVIANLGRADELAASGALASLLASGAKLTDQVLLINALDEDADGALSVVRQAHRRTVAVRQDLGAARHRRRPGRSAEGPRLRVSRSSAPCSSATLHRLFVSGSDRDCASWMEDYDIPGAEGLDLHHFYRAMAWLGEELEEKPDGALAPRCVKDVIEEKLFDRRRDLFTDLSAVFMDTTSLSFYGEGGETLGEHGYSKDYRPDLKQMILAWSSTATGRPICTEMWPGNTADVTTLLPVIDRLRQRFSIGRVCVVADRGMISAATIAGLEERKLEYILGARERSDAIVRKIVLENDDPFVPLLVERKAGETQLFVKQVKVEGKRYIVCRNEAEAENDRKDREAIVAALDAQLKKGDKALIGNSAYRRYLRKSRRPRTSPLIRDRRRQARRRGALRRHLRACAPTPRSRRCRRSCAIAICSRSKTCSRGPRRSCARGRSSIPPTPPSAAMYSAPSWRSSMQKYLDDLARRGRRRAGMEEPPARSRPPAAGAHPPSRRRLAGAHRRRLGCGHALQMRRMSPCRRAPTRRRPRRQPRPNLARKRRGRPRRSATPT